MRKATICAAAILCLLSAAASTAQVSLGEISGYVRDDQGAAIAGAQITVTSPSLMGKRQAQSGSRGEYRIINLPPGIYNLTITKENYEGQEVTTISVRAEKVTTLNLTLKIGNFEQTIVIESNTPIIDLKDSGQKYQISGEFQSALPIHERRNFHEILRLLPGSAIDNVDSIYANYRVHGADSRSGNNWLIDGAQVTSWDSGFGNSANVNTDIIDDASIQITSISASQPMGQGATISFVTKSGGNELSGSANLQLKPKQWNDTNVEGGTSADEDFTQTAFTLGGPILQDRLWFFGSYRFTNIVNGLARSNTVINDLKALFPGWQPFDIEKKQHTYFLKGSYAVNDSNNVFVSYQREWGPETFGEANASEAALIKEGYGGPFVQANWTTTIGDNLSVVSSFSYRDKPWYREGNAGDSPSITISQGWSQNGNEYIPGVPIAYDGNYREHYKSTATSWEIKSDANYFVDDFHGSHELEFGFYAQPDSQQQMIWDYSNSPDFEYKVPVDLSDYSKGTRTWGRVYYDGDTEYSTKLIGRNYAFYLNDTWKPNDRITISAGIRWDRVESSDELNGNVEDTASMDAITPVLGLTWAVTEDGRNVVRASYRLSHDGFRGGLLASSGQAITLGTRSEYDLDGDGIFEIQTVTPGSNIAPSDDDFSDRTVPYSHDFSAGFSRELPWNITASIDYTYRQFRNGYYNLNVNRIFENGEFVGLVDPTRNAIWKYTNNTWNWLEYQGIDIQINKHMSDDFQFMASMSHEWTLMHGTWAPDDIFGYLQPDAFFSYGGGDGISQTFRPQGPNFRFNAVWNTPWYGIVASVSTIHLKGTWSGPIYKILDGNDPEFWAHGMPVIQQGQYWVSNPLFTPLRLAFENRAEGQWRSPMTHKINLRLGKRFSFGERYRAEVAVDVFNLFNFDEDRYPYYLGNMFGSVDSTGKPYYGTNYSTQSPRSAQMFISFWF